MSVLDCKPAANGLLPGIDKALAANSFGSGVAAALGTTTAEFFPPPRSGRQLRALIASLVI